MTAPVRQVETVLLVDDHPLVRKGLRALLDGEAGVTVIGEAGDGQEAIDQVKALAPDVVVMDVSMPKTGGIEATRRIQEEAPKTKIVALSIHSEQRYVDEMLRAGASGYVLKDSAPEELARAIHAVLRGEGFLSPSLIGTVISGYRSVVPTASSAADTVGEILLQTKLHRPAPPRDLVPRRALHESLDAARVRPLTLVSAPPGYGKSMLISSWLERNDWRSAWVSLDEGDSDLRQFLSYFAAAVGDLFPAACEWSRGLATAPTLPPVSSLAVTITNGLEAIDQPFILVLDDYHRIDVNSPIHDLLQRLLDHPPIPLHLMIITRRDPPLSLFALRASGQMFEIRMQELQFNLAEARLLLEDTAGVRVNDATLLRLDRELEGWVVGLRLVSLAVRQAQDADAFLQQLQGGVQQTQEYLFQEVIARQALPLRDWLLKSAVLDRFCGSLCEAVCREGGVAEASELDGARFILALRDGNLFTVSLDPQGQWFRFHHLFQALLLRELTRRMAPDAIAGLHLRARRWFESRGMIGEAITHALRAGDAVGAAEVVERSWRAELNQDRWYLVKQWLDLLPAESRAQRQGLILADLWLANTQQQFERLPFLVGQLESTLDDTTADPQIAHDLNFFYGLLEYWQGNGERSLSHLDKAIAARSGRPGIVDGWVDLYFALALCMQGRKGAAAEALNEGLHGAYLSVHYRSQLIGSLVFVELTDGELMKARAHGQQLKTEMRVHRIANTEAWSDYLLGCTYLHANELDAASAHFAEAASKRHVLEPKAALETLAGLALTQTLAGQTDEADDTVDRLMTYARDQGGAEIQAVVDSCRARLQVLRGKLTPAMQWARSINPTPTPDALFTWLEVPSMTRARVLVAVGSEEALEDAARQLAAVRQQSESCHFTGQTIEAAVLQSLLREKQGRRDEALQSLQEAVALAAPGGWIRPFIELGQPMADLLGRLAKQTVVTDHLRLLVDAVSRRQSQPAGVAAGAVRTAAAGEGWHGEPLTRRELDILELLAHRLQNKEIAARLFVSPETVKTHLKHLYQKLGVTNRREAAATAIEILAATRAGARDDDRMDAE